MKKVCLHIAVLSFFVLGLVGSHTAYAQSKRGVTPEDYFPFKFISDLRISPDGKAVVYVLTIVNQKKNHRESSLWSVQIDGSLTPHCLSAEGFNSNSPRWSPDGKTLAIISTRTTESSDPDPPKPQIYLLPMAVGGNS